MMSRDVRVCSGVVRYGWAPLACEAESSSIFGPSAASTSRGGDPGSGAVEGARSIASRYPRIEASGRSYSPSKGTRAPSWAGQGPPRMRFAAPPRPRGGPPSRSRRTRILLIAAGVPIEVVSERLGHDHPAFTMHTYQHVLPGMGAAAADQFAALVTAASR